MNAFSPIFVAEVKTMSPFGFRSPIDFSDIFRCANKYGDMISIHVEPEFDGSLEKLKYAKRVALTTTQKPILAKGFHRTDDAIERSLDAGADRVLVVGRLPADKYLDKIWFEPKDMNQLMGCPEGVKIVWNQRDLLTGKYKPTSPAPDGSISTSIRAARLKRPHSWMCQASFIRKPGDVMTEPGVQAFIVGEHLVEFVNRLW